MKRQPSKYLNHNICRLRKETTLYVKFGGFAVRRTYVQTTYQKDNHKSGGGQKKQTDGHDVTHFRNFVLRFILLFVICPVVMYLAVRYFNWILVMPIVQGLGIILTQGQVNLILDKLLDSLLGFVTFTSHKPRV